jgi:hypothetical protein
MKHHPHQSIVLTLARRPDRLAAFQARWAASAPRLPRPAVHFGHDGAADGAPRDFDGSPGAYGCWISHARIWAAAAHDRRRVAVFEDDCTFLPTFADRLDAALANCPADADLLFLGGQHLEPPARNPHLAGLGLCLCAYPNRTHAYILDGASPRVQAAAKRLAEWHSPARRRGVNGHHVDYLIGELALSGRLLAYACDPFIAGQAAGTSDTTGKTVDPKDWN